MKYALVNEQSVEAFSGGSAVCRLCGTAVIAKCGEHRVHHWAHKGLKNCDSWAEGETQWHRDWKNKFPLEWQEFIQYDQQSGEKHIADVRTSYGLVVEFQRSPISQEEQASRELFYQNMIWVVDGTRLKRDYPRFLKGKDGLRQTPQQGFSLTFWPEELFSDAWLHSTVPVFFDFFGNSIPESPDLTQETLWCLLPGRAEGQAVVVGVLRKHLIAIVSNGPNVFLPSAKEVVGKFSQYLRDIKRAEEMRAAHAFSRQQPIRRSSWKRYRRF